MDGPRRRWFSCSNQPVVEVADLGREFAFSRDPWAGESYSADTLNAAPGDTDILAARAGRIHFAGEQTICGHQRSCIMLDRLVPRVVQRHRPFESGGSSSAFARRLESPRLAWRAGDRSEDQP